MFFTSPLETAGSANVLGSNDDVISVRHEDDDAVGVPGAPTLDLGAEDVVQIEIVFYSPNRGPQKEVAPFLWTVKPDSISGSKPVV